MCSLVRTVSTKACPPWEATSAGTEVYGTSHVCERLAALRIAKAHQSVAWRVEQGLYICGIIFTRYILSGITSCVRGSGVSHAKFKLSGLKRSMANCVAIANK